MDPVTLLIVALTFSAGIGGYLYGFKKGKVSVLPKEIIDENRILKKKVEELQYDLDWANTYLKREKDKSATIEQQRDTYRKMAESHEVKYPTPPSNPKPRKVWEDKVYRGLPEANLAALQADLEEFKGTELSLNLMIRGVGGWSQIIQDAGWHETRKVYEYGRYVMQKVPVSHIGVCHFEGPPDRVCQEIRTFLTDDNTGLVKSGKGAKQWKDEDSPLKFEVTLSVSGMPTPKLPEVHTVEVAVVEERIVDRIIEKPARPFSEEDAPELCGHTKEEIVDLIDAVLDVRGVPSDKPRVEVVEASEEIEA